MVRVAMRRVRACLWPPDKNLTLVVSLFSRPNCRGARVSQKSFLILGLRPHFKAVFWARLKARDKFSSMVILGEVPKRGS